MFICIQPNVAFTPFIPKTANKEGQNVHRVKMSEPGHGLSASFVFSGTNHLEVGWR